MLGWLFYQKICTQWPSTLGRSGAGAVEGFAEAAVAGEKEGLDSGLAGKPDSKAHQRLLLHRPHLHLRCQCQSNLVLQSDGSRGAGAEIEAGTDTGV